MNSKSLEAELLALKHELHQLRGVNHEQGLKIAELLQENNKLARENKNLQKQLIKLQDKLNINSTNSGLPTSKDVYRIERRSKPSSGRSPGGQPDYKYKGYEPGQNSKCSARRNVLLMWN